MSRPKKRQNKPHSKSPAGRPPASLPRNGMRQPRVSWRPGNLVVPTPAALVSCGRSGETPNLLTVAWCGNINSDPVMLSVSIRPQRHSHDIVMETGEFILNIPSTRQARAVDFCGVVSGREMDKFTAAGLSPEPLDGFTAPAVAGCPVAVACKIFEHKSLGSHTLFLATVESVSVSARLIDERGRFMIEEADLLCYAHGHYFALGSEVGHFGWSVRRKRK